MMSEPQYIANGYQLVETPTNARIHNSLVILALKLNLQIRHNCGNVEK